MEPLNKGHIGIRSTVSCRMAVLISEAVKPLNKGHIGSRFIVRQTRWYIFSSFIGILILEYPLQEVLYCTSKI